MRNFRKRMGWRDVMESWPVLGFLGALLLFFAWGVIGFLGKMQVTAANKRQAEEKVAELSKERERLSADIEKLKTIEGQEASIREKFGLAKDGEGEIVIVDDKATSESQGASSSGFFNFFTKWFK